MMPNLQMEQPFSVVVERWRQTPATRRSDRSQPAIACSTYPRASADRWRLRREEAGEPRRVIRDVELLVQLWAQASDVEDHSRQWGPGSRDGRGASRT